MEGIRKGRMDDLRRFAGLINTKIPPTILDAALESLGSRFHIPENGEDEESESEKHRQPSPGNLFLFWCLCTVASLDSRDWSNEPSARTRYLQAITKMWQGAAGWLFAISFKRTEVGIGHLEYLALVSRLHEIVLGNELTRGCIMDSAIPITFAAHLWFIDKEDEAPEKGIDAQTIFEGRSYPLSLVCKSARTVKEVEKITKETMYYTKHMVKGVDGSEFVAEILRRRLRTVAGPKDDASYSVRSITMSLEIAWFFLERCTNRAIREAFDQSLGLSLFLLYIGHFVFEKEMDGDALAIVTRCFYLVHSFICEENGALEAAIETGMTVLLYKVSRHMDTFDCALQNVLLHILEKVIGAMTAPSTFYCISEQAGQLFLENYKHDVDNFWSERLKDMEDLLLERTIFANEFANGRIDESGFCDNVGGNIFNLLVLNT